MWRAAADFREDSTTPRGGVQIDRTSVELDLTSEAAGDVEQVGYQLGLRVGILLDDFERVGRALRRHRAAAEQRDPSDDRVQRCSQLVGDERQELVLEPIGSFGACARRFERGLDPTALVDFSPGIEDAFFERAAIFAHPIQNDARSDDEAGVERQPNHLFPRVR